MKSLFYLAVMNDTQTPNTMTSSLKVKVKNFMSTDPSECDIEKFYLNCVLPYDSRSIEEILEND